MPVSTFHRGFLKSFGSLILAGVLVACGGGSDAPAIVGPSPAVPVTPTVTVATPVVAEAPASNPTVELTQSGLMNYLVYRVNAGGNAIETTTLTGTVSNALSGGAGTLSLALSPTPLVVNTTDTWVNFIWPGTYKGVLSLEGNVGLVCDTASAATTGQVGMSHNMQAVTSLEELKGLNFAGYDCSTNTLASTYSFNFLADGSLDADGDMVEAGGVSALFSENGLDIENLNLKLRAYKIQQGGQTRYAAALLFVETHPSTGVRSYGVELLLN